MTKTTWRKGIPLDPLVAERLRLLVREQGEKEAAELIGVGVGSIVRAAAGLGLRRGTAFTIEAKLGTRAA